jgi:hypothetical protein
VPHRSAETATYPGEMARVEIDIPEELQRRIEEYVERTGETPGELLRRFAEQEIAVDDARRRKEFEKLLGPPLPPGTDVVKMIREERDNDLWH